MSRKTWLLYDRIRRRRRASKAVTERHIRTTQDDGPGEHATNMSISHNDFCHSCKDEKEKKTVHCFMCVKLNLPRQHYSGQRNDQRICRHGLNKRPNNTLETTDSTQNSVN